MQQRFPSLCLHEKICGGFGNQDVAGVSAIHHPLRDIDTAAGHVAVGVDVCNSVHGSRVNAHAQLDLGMLSELEV